MIFSVAIQMQNNDIHTMNINALSFNHADKKINEYCHVIGRKYNSNDYYYKKAQVAGIGSSMHCLGYPIVKISNKKVNGSAIITKKLNSTYNLL